jgi:hypothetical protein
MPIKPDTRNLFFRAHGLLFLFTGTAIAATIVAGFWFARDVTGYVQAWLQLHIAATGANSVNTVGRYFSQSYASKFTPADDPQEEST